MGNLSFRQKLTVFKDRLTNSSAIFAKIIAQLWKAKVWLNENKPFHKVRFSAYKCFSRVNDESSKRPLKALGSYLSTLDGLAISGDIALASMLIQINPELKESIIYWIAQENEIHDLGSEVLGIPTVSINSIPSEVKHVFLSCLNSVDLHNTKCKLPENIHAIEPSKITQLDWKAVPAHAWIFEKPSVYPTRLPEVRLREGIDLLLLDCPAKNLGLMPNGLAYVHNALKKEGINFQTFDIDVVMYHTFHMHRILDGAHEIRTPSGKLLPTDPWGMDMTLTWQNEDSFEYFKPQIDALVQEIILVKPKILALSIHDSNVLSSRYVVEQVRKDLPDIIVLVGGYSCLDPNIGLRAFPLADYMTIAEADLTVGPLVREILSGSVPKDMPGVLSQHDSPQRQFSPGPLPHNLDELDFPNYEWFDLQLYRGHMGNHTAPIVGSRGCRWSRCRFCTERFFWRTRTPENFIQELLWLYERGYKKFSFNDSDFNCDHDFVKSVCLKIIELNLNVTFYGQLRVHPKNTLEFFHLLRRAGFRSLHFGADAWSTHTLKIASKGYTTSLIEKNLRDCAQAGLVSEVNLIVGYPGETESDIQETIDNIVKLKDYISIFSVLNPLMMKVGSVFWEEGAKYKISYRQDKNKLFEKFPFGIPANMWYSDDPYIDHKVRAERVYRISKTLDENGITLGHVARQRLREMQQKRDVLRAGEITIDQSSDEGEISDVTQVTPRLVVPFGMSFYATAVSRKPGR